jgi:hypothetical protein
MLLDRCTEYLGLLILVAGSELLFFFSQSLANGRLKYRLECAFGQMDVHIVWNLRKHFFYYFTVITQYSTQSCQHYNIANILWEVSMLHLSNHQSVTPETAPLGVSCCAGASLEASHCLNILLIHVSQMIEGRWAVFCIRPLCCVWEVLQ